MSERKNNPLRARLETLALSPIVGAFFGGISYAAAYYPLGAQTAESIGIGLGGAFGFGALGAELLLISGREAVEHAEMGRVRESRLRLSESFLEGSLSFGMGEAIAGFEAGGDTGALVGLILGSALGGSTSLAYYQEKVKPDPKLIFPTGNTTEFDTRFPRELNNIEIPPVLKAKSIQDFQEFREANKEIITKWVNELPTKSDNPGSLLSKRFVTAVGIINSVQHYPALDPEKDGVERMKLLDINSSGSAIAGPAEYASLFWPYDTNFEDQMGLGKRFNFDKWSYWKDKSWRHQVVLLAQYQAPASSVLKGVDPKTVTDNYWLLDIISSNGGVRKKVKKAETKGVLVPGQELA